MKDLYIAESVSEGHPDKLCDSISDAILDEVIKQDKNSRVACETLAHGNKIILAGEITTKAKIDYELIVRQKIKEIGYSSKFNYDPDTVEIINTISNQSPEISSLVSKAFDDNKSLGAGDQGIVVGYATNETENYMPSHYNLATAIVKRSAKLRKEGILDFLGPDSKSQVAIDKSDKKNHKLVRVLFSTQHTKDIILDELRIILKNKLILPLVKEYGYNEDFDLLINPAGTFHLGGPVADAGLTGRKLMIDTYGVSANHGGGAFSGKDATKVDRSAAYMARYIAKNLVANNIDSEVEVFISYTIGFAKPFGINVWLTDHPENRDKVIDLIEKNFDLRPSSIIKKFKLDRPLFSLTSNYGHFGREDIDLPWEKIDKKLVLK